MNKRQSVANEGRVCLTDHDHGPSLILPSGREWCPSQSHDGGGKRKRKPTTPWLDKQVIEDDQTDRPDAA